MVFVNSMSDLFLEEIPSAFIAQVFETMRSAPQHTFQVLTKRPGRMVEWLESRRAPHPMPKNIWLGVSVENSTWLKRIDVLRSAKATVRFVSFEPLLGDMQLRSSALRGIDWVIVGGETGPAARRMEPSWVSSIYSACKARGIPFFFKQWGVFDSSGRKVGRQQAGRIYRHKEWNQMPRIVASRMQQPRARG
jgi:protein gp37